MRQTLSTSQKLTCIIPLYNDEKYIIRAITSALNQSEACDVIVIDDASSDEGGAIVAGFARKHSRVKLFSLCQNSGQGVARNFGVLQAGTPYIVFLDSDDEHIGEFYKTAIMALEQNPHIASIEGQIEYYGKYKNSDFAKGDERLSIAENTSPINRVMRKSTFLTLGGFPNKAEFRSRLGGEDAAFIQAYKTVFNCIKMNMYVVKSFVKENSYFCKYIESVKYENGKTVFDDSTDRALLSAAMGDYANESFAGFANTLNCINKNTFS